MPSSAIRLISHDEASERLTVTFVTGRTYVYESVPEKVYRDFLAAESKGRFFNDTIRDRFTFREITSKRQRNRSAA
jgi:hypothetical protein